MVSPEMEDVVGVHHAVDEADQQPARDEIGLTRDDAGEQGVIGALCLEQVRIVAGDDVVGEPADRAGVAADGEELEGADADVARGDARQHRAGQRGLADDVLAGDDRGERARGRDAEREHGFADDVFTQHRTRARHGRRRGGRTGWDPSP